MKEIYITTEDLECLRKNSEIVVYGDQFEKVRLKVY